MLAAFGTQFEILLIRAKNQTSIRGSKNTEFYSNFKTVEKKEQGRKFAAFYFFYSCSQIS